MSLLNNKLNLFILFFISFLPISILIGPSISIINILILSLSGVFIFFLYQKEFYLTNHKVLKLLFILYFYLIFNTLIALDYQLSFNRNIGFLRYIFLFISINYFFFVNKKNEFFLKIWTIVLLVVFFDVFFEFYNGKNILGFTSLKNRIASFFKNEAIIGSFINGFFFILLGFLLKIYRNKNILKNLPFILFLFTAIICVIFTGERSSTIKLFLGIFLFFFILKKTKYIFSITILTSLVILIAANFGQYKVLKTRFYDDVIPRIFNSEIRENYLYFKLYKTGFNVFKEYPIFGVGNKNFRVETCRVNKAAPIINNFNKKYQCNTHPHQIYFEFLSEHGIIGSIILLIIFYNLIFKNFKKMIRDKNFIQIGSFCYLSTIFIPIIPSGSFFSDFNSTFFFINLSFYYAANYETNIFKKNDN
jgi:O-antigen ligase